MEGAQGSSSSSSKGLCTSAMTLSQLGDSHVPQRYVLPPSQRPNPTPKYCPSTNLPIIDLSSLQHPSLRSNVIHEIRMACKELGFFQVINHGVPQSVINHALEAATEFFNLPIDEKMLLFSDDIHEPVRYGTSLNHVVDQVYFWRDFLKHYSHPISDWIHLWPSNPPTYKEKMANYTKAIHVLQKQLMGLVFESLGLNPNYLEEEVENGSEVLAVNCYPACPQPELTLGIPPHSDYGALTILLQSCPGLQVMDSHNNWVSVPAIQGALIVQLGDQMEVISNGQYKGVVHRATVNMEKRRFSIASLHSLALSKKIGPAPQLVDEQHPKAYKEFSFKDFLDFISRNDIMEGRFLDTVKNNP
ncbi:flavanone 3-dioxygenase 3-like [Ziziphus jujuba]|uniref:Flavanone 3-dioxygenase 3-like n=1 Tax=Ziziphus jujuba TaxID=326968 RepID=A0ABM4A843_ZIZJJ|nr:flavanone 3-dioxygenase 3-like [Ziziphus jujuba]